MLPALACQMRCSVIQKGYGTTFLDIRKDMRHQKESPDISPSVHTIVFSNKWLHFSFLVTADLSGPPHPQQSIYTLVAPKPP